MTTTHDDLDTMSLSGATEVGAREGGDKHYFGEITIVDVWKAAWPKGQPRPIPFDEGQHTRDQMRVFVQLKVTCTKRDGTTYDLDQEGVTSGSQHAITLKSLEALGVRTVPELRALNGAGKFCQVVRVPTGRKYAAKKDAKDGSYKAGDMIPEFPALKFLALYDSADECRAAEAAFYAPRGEGRNQPQPVTAADTGSAPVIARETLLGTLPALVMASGKNAETLQTILNGNPAYAQAGISAQSPEVVALMAA